MSTVNLKTIIIILEYILKKKWLLSIAIIYLFTFYSNSYARMLWIDHKDVCEKTRGTWRLFGDDCADNCDSKADLLFCTSNSFFSCDCGHSRCWNGDICVSTKSYQIQFEEKIKKIKSQNQSKIKEIENSNQYLEEQKDSVSKLALQQEVEINYAQKNIVTTTISDEQIVKDDDLNPIAKNNNKDQNTSPPQDKDQELLCKNENGSWKQFSNGCAGSCGGRVSAHAMCTAALTFGCECGDGKCWDQTTKKCLMIQDYKSFLLERFKK